MVMKGVVSSSQAIFMQQQLLGFACQSAIGMAGKETTSPNGLRKIIPYTDSTRKSANILSPPAMPVT